MRAQLGLHVLVFPVLRCSGLQRIRYVLKGVPKLTLSIKEMLCAMLLDFPADENHEDLRVAQIVRPRRYRTVSMHESKVSL